MSHKPAENDIYIIRGNDPRERGDYFEVRVMCNPLDSGGFDLVLADFKTEKEAWDLAGGMQKILGSTIKLIDRTVKRCEKE